MTDAPDTLAPDRLDDIVEAYVTAWRAELAGQTSVSATEVQDRLLDLWPEMAEGERRMRLEAWITETLSRHLYSVTDLEERLASL